jgi:hypothetical protein
MEQSNDPAVWERRRTVLKQQAERLRRHFQEAAGQLTLPIFGDGTEKLPVLSEAAALIVSKGLHVTEKKA